MQLDCIKLFSGLKEGLFFVSIFFMSFALTLVSHEKNLSAGHFATLESYLSDTDIIVEKQPEWLSDHKAGYVVIHDCLNIDQMNECRALLAVDKIDVLITPVPQPRIQLLVSDMDSTIVDGETLDDMAATLGIGEEVAVITEKSMRGEVNFEESLRERVALLAGKDAKILEDIKKDIKLMPGAVTLIRTMGHMGARCVLVTGGFTHISDYVAQICGFCAHHANRLQVEDGRFTGQVSDPILGPTSKAEILEKTAFSLGIDLPHTLAMGDGANDLNMLELAGLSFGFRPKPILAQSILNVINYCDLTAILYAQGIKEEDIIHGE